MTASAERDQLRSHLDAQRRHVLQALEGLSEQDLRRPLLPSGWSCLGLVRHLTKDVELFWFRGPVAAEPEVIAYLDEAPDDGWQVGDDVAVATVLDGYATAIERSNAVIDATALDAPPAWWPTELFGTWRLDDLRAVLLHVLVETATHAGHLDAARELVDGRQWLVLTEEG